MCGICGIYDKSHHEVEQDTIIKMRDIMVSRGPDDAGIYLAPHIGMGHRRLSIIDLSSAGHQPLSNEDGTIWITFNGEIYNFSELRDELIAGGHRFHSRTDTEVLVHGYEEWGPDVLLRKISGMFAFAIWDSRCKALILARDRLGVKPLFYMEHGKQVRFSSDIRSFYLVSEDALTINHRAIDHFLFSYCIPQEYAIFNEVRKVPPGHYVRFDTNGTRTGKYWDLRFSEKERMDEQEMQDEVERRVRLAVQRRMISDVPIGAFLSGGVDSSLVVALMAQESSSRIKTFSMGVREDSYNELKYARMVAERYGTDHHEFIVEPDALSILPEIIWNYGEPFADSSQIPTYYISRLTRDHVKVALTGDGGDESFCGYSNTLLSYFVDRYRKYSPALFSDTIFPRLADMLVARMGRRGLAGKIKTLVEYGSGTLADSIRRGGVFGFDHREKLYTPGLKEMMISHDPIDIYEKYSACADGHDEVDRALYVDIKTWLPNDYLTKVDVATMMNSLEARSPFLDHELVEFAARIPSSMKLKYGRQKYLLKKVASRHVPHPAIYRKKWGFGIPVGAWFRNDLAGLLKDILLSDRALGRGYFVEQYIETLMKEHLSGTRDHTHRLWSLLCLELWHLMFIDKTITGNTSLL